MTTLITIGIDEAGRGPWAGPVVAGAVMLNPEYPEDAALMRDSKKMKPAARQAVYQRILEKHAYGIGWAHAHEIDGINILQATFVAMQRATLNLMEKLDPQGMGAGPTILRIDGNRLPAWTAGPGYQATAIIKGDDKEACISAASIVAKEARDAWMQQMHKLYPMYGFSDHMGYGTPKHMTALQQHGPCQIHRMTFAPIKAMR